MDRAPIWDLKSHRIYRCNTDRLTNDLRARYQRMHSLFERAFAKHSRFISQFMSRPIDSKAAQAYGPLRATLEQSGMLIGSNDLMIAAIAIANQMTLVTRNTAEIQRVTGLMLEDWEA